MYIESEKILNLNSNIENFKSEIEDFKSEIDKIKCFWQKEINDFSWTQSTMQICQLRDANNTISNLLNNRIDDNRLQKFKDAIDLITKNADISEELRTSIQNKLGDDQSLNKIHFEKEYSILRLDYNKPRGKHQS